ncbi:hypothetical protein CBR_g70697 [Chara braunii]|uniref:Uncharacterized protein n=1 Tax=Chara braunii TaxID=69332 RepID=A0A388K9W9_CHABU|nr:hypothetical protein CBR_g70697 [Chara braunii]|eukprot:GBG66819.1 hypothetical protein CBR_g70697 [Chara braunii]
MMMHAGMEMKAKIESTERFCTGTIEGAKLAAPKEEEARPRRKSVKVKFLDSYSGKKEENFDNWDANVNSYVHLHKILREEQVLIDFHALRDEAASFARSPTCASQCENNMVAYSKVTPLPQFFRLLRERFADVSRSVRASDKLQTIHSHQWKSARALKGVMVLMDELVAVPDHVVTETQLVNLFYRAMPQPLRGHFFKKSKLPTMTYDILSREVVAFKAQSMPVSTFWHKDLDKGKKWKGRTISGQVRAKDHLILTLDEGGMEEVPDNQIEWGLEEEDSSNRFGERRGRRGSFRARKELLGGKELFWSRRVGKNELLAGDEAVRGNRACMGKEATRSSGACTRKEHLRGRESAGGRSRAGKSCCAGKAVAWGKAAARGKVAAGEKLPRGGRTIAREE